MSLATTADVRRWLDETDAEAPGTILQPFLDDASEEVKRVTGRDWDASGAVSETFASVQQGDLLTLKDENPTSLTIRAYLTPTDGGRDLQAAEYSLHPLGRLKLRRDVEAFAERAPAFPRRRGGLGDALLSVDVKPVTYDRVVVTYTASNEVPTPVREAVALTAAAMYRQRGPTVSGVESEKIGDYSYTRRKDGKGALPPEALERLKDYMGAGKVGRGQLIF
jgi:hypothetical protein